MRKAGILLAIILWAVGAAQGQTGTEGRSGGELNFGVTDGRAVITRDIGGGLLLRAVKERSATQEHYGWRIEVVRKPFRKDSRNLLYHSRRTVGAHPSQVYAWHVTSGHFPKVRELPVEGRPVLVRVELMSPAAEGEGPDSRFVSGQLKISWGRSAGHSHPKTSGT